MDVDVRNALDKLFLACDHIQAVAPKDSVCANIKETVIADIFGFIDSISVARASERKSFFAKTYLEGTILSKPTEVLPILCQIDNQVLPGQKLKTAELYVSFLFELGRNYSLSKYDKRDIDLLKFASEINRMKDYISKQQSLATEQKEDCVALKTQATNAKSNVTSKAIQDDTNEAVPAEESLETLLAQLNALIGLSGVKQEVNSLINILKMKQLRAERGLKSPDVSKHLVFSGNPGTGKTTVARLLAKIYKQLGVLEKGQLVEVDRSGLVAGYVGQTAIKTQERIDEAMGGVLFIDEAYTLAKGGTDFGQEAIDTLLKAMEDKRDSFVVVVAGYSSPMETFLESNPGLKSRFNKNIVFEDYSKDELFAIFQAFCVPYGLNLDHDAERFLMTYLDSLMTHKPENFANGREMRNLFETMVANQANRLAESPSISDDDLCCFLKADLPAWVLDS